MSNLDGNEIDKIIEEKITEAKKNPKVRIPRGWIKISSDGWLHGSINYRMTPGQIGVFSKLLVMGDKFGPVAGLISDNNFNPLPHDYLAYQACCTIELFEETLELAKNDDAIYESINGIFIVNFDKYQFTEYDRQKPYRDKKRLTDDHGKFKGQKHDDMVQR